MSYEGAMLGGYLLPEKIFKQNMQLLLDKQKNEILQQLVKIQQLIEMGQVDQVFIEWDKFQSMYLQNPKTELLSILNFYGKDYSQQWVFADEATVITQEGKIQMTKAIENDTKQVYYSKILSQHLFNLYNSVLKDKVLYEEETEEAMNYSSTIKQHLNDIKDSDKNYTYKNLIYGQNAKEFMWRGKIADAFVNHLGKIHPEIFVERQNFFTKGQHFLKLHNTVKNEENSRNQFGFLHLLLDSLNNTGWWTGGDLIITDKSGKVIASLQLKTSKGSGEWIGNIKTSTLNKHINLLIKEISNNSKKAVDVFYDTLKTSTVSEALGDNVLKEVQSALQKILT